MENSIKQEIFEIMLKMTKRNVENGSTFEEAKTQVYNRFNLEYPEVLKFFINAS